ncbi:hypothetical protein D5S17_07160 [Pseudonocardiaceae bacterium YIM PH 21723]|nr:hypothetical protein D5S17_07160 [Pseudonocardiaceae bacterium YIM PH 21723]
MAGVLVPDSPGTTVGFAVFDRSSAEVVAAHNADMRFRSASIVKLLIALDYLWDRGPDYQVPAADAPLLEAMLRASDDDAASTLWVRAGWEQIVVRMADRLGLADTSPPDERGKWGRTAISPRDTVEVYRHILDRAPGPVREYLVTNLLAHTRCGSDGWDQSFGIPSATRGPWGVKQGWSGFPDPRPDQRCVPPPAPEAGPEARLAGPGDIDITRRAMHSTGFDGDSDRIVVIYTLQPQDRSWELCGALLTGLAGALIRL